MLAQGFPVKFLYWILSTQCQDLISTSPSHQNRDVLRVQVWKARLLTARMRSDDVLKYLSSLSLQVQSGLFLPPRSFLPGSLMCDTNCDTSENHASDGVDQIISGTTRFRLDRLSSKLFFSIFLFGLCRPVIATKHNPGFLSSRVTDTVSFQH